MTFLAMALLPLVLHAMFVTAEYAFVRAACTQPKMIDRAQQRAIQDITDDLETYLRVCQIGKTIALLCLGIYLGSQLGTAQISETIKSSVVSQFILFFGFLALVTVHVVVAFELPKILGVTKTEQCLRTLSGFLIWARYILAPMVWTVKKLACAEPQAE